MLLLISLLSFLLPTQLGLHLDNQLFTSVAGQTVYTVYGFRIDYLIPTIYLTDIIVFLIIIIGFRKIKFNSKYKLIIFSLLLFAVINTLHSSMIVAAIYKWIKVFEMLLLGAVLVNTKKFDIFKNFIKPLSCSMFIICILGIWQYLIKGSVGGIFYWLGERSFVFNNPDIAPYVYATFSHPNSFAGFLLVFAIFLLKYKNKFNNERRLGHKYFWTLTILVIINLILTNSLNVYIAICLILVLKFRPNLSFSFLALASPTGGFDFSQRFVTHRLELINASWQMIKKHFFLGVGLNNFIPNLVKVSNTFVNSWELQPVHNIFLLIFSEVGLMGLSFFLVLLSSLTFNYQLLAILITGLSDHYWLTLQQNLLLFTYVVVISRKQRI